MQMQMTVDQALSHGGTGQFQKRLLGILGLVWAGNAMQTLAVGFTASSLAATFGITVPRALQTGTLFFVGMLIGAVLFGRIADRIGRRNTLILTVGLDAIFALASVFANDFMALLALRFLTGAAVGGTLPVDHAVMAEFLPPRSRGRWLVLLGGFWAVGTVVIVLTAGAMELAQATEAFRAVFFMAALPVVIGAGLRLWVPETPLYLLRRGRAVEARRVLDRIMRRNGVEALPEGVVVSMPPSDAIEGGLFGPMLRQRTLALLALWFFVSLAYYGTFIWLLPQSTGEGSGFVAGYGILLWLAVVQLPGYALAVWAIEAWGRRLTLVLFLFLSATGCAVYAYGTLGLVVILGLSLMSFALLGTWGVLYAFTAELYPTGLRGTGMGTASAAARLAGLLAPMALAPLVAAKGFPFTVSLFAMLLVIGIVAVLAIRAETRDRALN